MSRWSALRVTRFLRGGLVPALLVLALPPAVARAIAAPAAPAAEVRPDFSGVWKLNIEASDDPREKMREAMRRRRGGYGGGRGGLGLPGGVPGGPAGGGIGGSPGGGGGGWGRHRGASSPNGPGDAGSQPSKESLRLLNEELAEIAIVHQDPQLTVRYADKRQEVLWTDDREPPLPDPESALPLAALLEPRAK